MHRHTLYDVIQRAVVDETFLNLVLHNPAAAVAQANLDISLEEKELLEQMKDGRTYEVTWPELLTGLHDLYASGAWKVGTWKTFPEMQ